MTIQPATRPDPDASAPGGRPTPRQLARALITPDRRRAQPARQMPMPDSLIEIDVAGAATLIRQWAPADDVAPTGSAVAEKLDAKAMIDSQPDTKVPAPDFPEPAQPNK